MEIRHAEMDDVSDLTRLRVAAVVEANPGRAIPQTFIEATSNHLIERFARSSILCWIAVADERIVATAAVVPFERLPNLSNFSGREGYVTSVYTEPLYRRRGLGGKLVQALVTDARAAHFVRLWLYSTPEGAGIYRQAGFTTKQRDEVEMHLEPV